MTVSRGWFIVTMLPSDIYCGVEHAANSTNHDFYNVYYFCLPHFLSSRVFFPFFHIWLCMCTRKYAHLCQWIFQGIKQKRKAKKKHTQTTTINSISLFSRLFHDDGNFLVVAFELLYLFLYLPLSVCVSVVLRVSVCAWTFPFLPVNMWITCASVWLIKILYVFAIFHQANGLSEAQFYFPFFSSLQFLCRSFFLSFALKVSGEKEMKLCDWL